MSPLARRTGPAAPTEDVGAGPFPPAHDRNDRMSKDTKEKLIGGLITAGIALATMWGYSKIRSKLPAFLQF